MGALALFAAGAVTGAFLASEKASGTRKKVSRKGRELAEALSREIDDKLENLMEKLASQRAINNDIPASRKSEKMTDVLK